MARQSASRTGGRDYGGRSMRGATPAERSRYLDESGKLIAPTLERWRDNVPVSTQLPGIVELNQLSIAELGDVLDKFGITEPWPQMRAAQVGYLSRLTSYPAGSPQFAAELDRLLDFDSDRGALAAARRAYHEYALATTDTSELLIRVAEDDPNTCDTCARLGGEIGTIDYHREIGLPGAASCDGGDRCRCQLIPASK